MPAPPMTPEKARDVGRNLKGMADQLTEAGDLNLAHNMQRQSEWYFVYALALATIQSGTALNPEDPNPASSRNAG